MYYEFCFVVEGISMNDSAAVEQIVERYDGQLSSIKGTHRIDAGAEGQDAVRAALELADEMSLAIPGLRILRTDPELVGVADIAELCQRSRQNVQQWVDGERNAEVPFPSHEGTVGRSLAWRWGDVNTWLDHIGLGDGVARPTREESLRIDLALLERLNSSKDPGAA